MGSLNSVEIRCAVSEEFACAWRRVRSARNGVKSERRKHLYCRASSIRPTCARKFGGVATCRSIEIR